jgi:hypothetical protein
VSLNPVHGEVYYSTTDPGSFKLTDISYRLCFSFVSFACIVRSFFVFMGIYFNCVYELLMHNLFCFNSKKIGMCT